MNIDDLEKKYEEMGKEIEILKQKELEDKKLKPFSGRGTILTGDLYLCPPRMGCTVDYEVAGMKWPTEESAKKHAKRLKVFNLMWQYAYQLNDGEVLTEGNVIELWGGNLDLGVRSLSRFGFPHFKSLEDAQRVVDSIGEYNVISFLKGE